MTPKPVKSRKVSAYVKLVMKCHALEAKLDGIRREIMRRRLEMTGSQYGQATILLNAAQAKLSHEAEASVVRMVDPHGKKTAYPGGMVKDSTVPKFNAANRKYVETRRRK